jgi:NADH-quinone oxidoreductase subunit A
MITDYLPVLLLAVTAVAFAGASLGVSVLLGKRGRRTREKDTAYECGKDPVEQGQPRFSVKFYLVAMLFIIFDIEVVFLYPWAVVYRDMLALGWGIFGSMFTFIGVLFAGYLYAVKKGALDWSRPNVNG